MYAEPSSDANDLRSSLKCFGDVFDEIVGKQNKYYKHRLHIKNITKILDRCEKITLANLQKR